MSLTDAIIEKTCLLRIASSPKLTPAYSLNVYLSSIYGDIRRNVRNGMPEIVCSLYIA